MKGKRFLVCGACGKRGVSWWGEEIVTVRCRYCKARSIFMRYSLVTVEETAANLRTTGTGKDGV